MKPSNGAAPRKRVLVTITPYTEQEKRVTNGSAPGGPPPPPLPLPAPATTAKSPEDTVEMQSIESFKLKEAPSPLIPKPPSTYFALGNSAGSAPSSATSSPRHQQLSPAKQQQQQQQQQQQLNGIANQSVNSNSVSQTTATDQKRGSPVARVAPVVPMSTFGPSKVAVRIGAYEGEAKQPSRLDFLPQTPPRAAPESASPAKNSAEEVVDAPVVSKLQNELAATLQRSNLRKKTEGENNTAIKSIPECPVVPTRNSSTLSENNTGVSLLQSNVEKLAAALSNRVTIKVSPENGSR